MTLILASRSPARRDMLAAADVPHEAEAPMVDEETARLALVADGRTPREIADALAELKALCLSARRPGALVLGCDQVLALDGETLGKPASRDDAAAQLRRLRGRPHQLISAAVACEGGRPVWRAVETATLHVRGFSEAWLARYIDAEWPAIGGCAGGYRIEGPGIQLFDRVGGSHHAVLGLPLLPLLAWLRERGVIPR